MNLAEMVEQNDALSVFVASRTDTDEFIEQFNSAPPGSKTAFKNRVRELEREGQQILQAYILDAKQMDQPDSLWVRQTIEEMGSIDNFNFFCEVLNGVR
jgi:hypothetical protein